MNKLWNLQTLSITLITLIILLIIYLVWKHKLVVYIKQEKELMMYKLYVHPLEEFIREIRARQHEFDNHLNALLSMHITIHEYDELVKAQADYMRSLVTMPGNTYLGLLKISNKVLAGFLYSKLVSAHKQIQVELIVGSKEIFTFVPEMEVVEVLGTLIDNAFDACNEAFPSVKLYLTSEEDRLIFIIKNQYEKVPIEELSKFFERGYSTKEQTDRRGLGLYNAKKIIERWKGEIYVENEEIQGKNYLSFHVEL